MDAIDIARLSAALAVEERARKSLSSLIAELKARRLNDADAKKVRRAVRKWMRAAKTVANVIGEQVPDN